MSGEDDDRADAFQAKCDYDWTRPLSYWREYAAEMYDAGLRSEVRDCVRRIGPTIDDARAAVDRDPKAAIKTALKMPMPGEIGARLDIVMTMLLNAAFDAAAAATAMADLVQRAPLDPVDASGISTSWRVHRIWLESIVRNAQKGRCSRNRGCDL
jgi:hypothetical protein